MHMKIDQALGLLLYQNLIRPGKVKITYRLKLLV